jgi:hypothetical protein
MSEYSIRIFHPIKLEYIILVNDTTFTGLDNTFRDPFHMLDWRKENYDGTEDMHFHSFWHNVQCGKVTFKIHHVQKNFIIWHKMAQMIQAPGLYWIK